MGKQSFVEKLTGTASGGIVPLSRATLNTPASNVCRVYSPIPGTITGLDVYAPNGSISGTWTFNFFVNGVAKFSGGTRMSVSEAARHATKTGLNFAVSKDDLLTFDLQLAGSGPLFGPVQFTIIIDDGVVVTLQAGDGIAVDNTDPANPIVTNTGVLSVVAGDGIAIDDTDPQNPIVHNDGVQSIVAGTNIAVDNTDPNNPVVSSSGGVESVVAGGGIAVDDTDPANPVVSTTGVDALTAGTGCSIDNTNPHNPVVNVTPGSGGVGTSNSWDVTLVKPNDESRQSNTTLTDDTDLKFTVLAGQKYAFEFNILVSMNTGAVSAKFRYSITQTAQFLRCHTRYTGNSVGSGTDAGPTTGVFDTNQTTGTTNVIGAANFFAVIQIKGSIQGHASNNSVFSFQWAQNASVAQNLNIERGSVMHWKKV